MRESCTDLSNPIKRDAVSFIARHWLKHRPYEIVFQSQDLVKYKESIQKLYDLFITKPSKEELDLVLINSFANKQDPIEKQASTITTKVAAMLKEDDITDQDRRIMAVSNWLMTARPRWSSKGYIRGTIGGKFDVAKRLQADDFNCYDEALIISTMLKEYGMNPQIESFDDLYPGHVFVSVPYSNNICRYVDISTGDSCGGFFKNREELKNMTWQKLQRKSKRHPVQKLLRDIREAKRK